MEMPKPSSAGKAELIVAALGKPKIGKDLGQEEMSDEADPRDEARLDAADGVMAALKSGNREEFADSLQDFIDMCNY